MPSQEEVNALLDHLLEVREERLELLPEAGTFTEVIADAMNALQVAYVMVSSLGAPSKETPQGTAFVSVSNPKDARPL